MEKGNQRERETKLPTRPRKRHTSIYLCIQYVDVCIRNLTLSLARTAGTTSLRRIDFHNISTRRRERERERGFHCVAGDTEREPPFFSNITELPTRARLIPISKNGTQKYREAYRVLWERGRVDQSNQIGHSADSTSNHFLLLFFFSYFLHQTGRGLYLFSKVARLIFL